MTQEEDTQAEEVTPEETEGTEETTPEETVEGTEEM